MSIKGKIQYFRSLVLAAKTAGPIVVIESDDWGSERIPSVSVQQKLAALNFDIHSNPYVKYDSLERAEDIERLADTLNSIYNDFGKKVVITANFVMANPDYAKIAASQFSEFHYESFKSTYYKRDASNRVWEGIQQLVQNGYFRPQFHAREHINTALWLEQLQTANSPYLKAFELECCGIDFKLKDINRNNLLAAFEYFNSAQKQQVIDSIKDGLRLFQQDFGFNSETLVAPRHVWNDELEVIMKAEGIATIQASLLQLLPGTNEFGKRYLYTGKVNAATAMKYLVRNVYFEPSYSTSIDWVKDAITKINRLFFFNIPVIIGMHRLNLAGGLSSENRERGLAALNALIREILKAHPKANFMSSDQLAKMIL